MSILAGCGARPPIKWNGGKTYAIERLRPYFAGRDWSDWHYIEPMFGGGAAYWEFGHLFRTRAIADVAPELVNLYRVIKADPDGLIEALRGPDFRYRGILDRGSKEHFHSMRERYGVGTPLQRAATFKFLNATSINGLHRFNRSGRFNAGPGSYVDPKFLDEPLLRACSTALAGTPIVCHGVTKLLGRIAACKSRKVLMFVDPPYHSERAGRFTGYAGGFSAADQAGLVRALLESGRRFLYLNAATDFIRSLFAGAAVSTATFPLTHKVGPKAARGRAAEELLVQNL